MNSIDMGRGQYEEEKRKIEIRIRNEFLLKMKAALEKARQSYHMKYQEFILKIERDADEVCQYIIWFIEFQNILDHSTV